jgi:hypothetical protein
MTDKGMATLLDAIGSTEDTGIVFAAGQVKAYGRAMELIDGMHANSTNDPRWRALLTVISSTLARYATEAANEATA